MNRTYSSGLGSGSDEKYEASIASAADGRACRSMFNNFSVSVMTPRGKILEIKSGHHYVLGSKGICWLTRTIPVQIHYHTPPLDASNYTKAPRVALGNNLLSDSLVRRRPDEAGESRLLHGMGLL